MSNAAKLFVSLLVVAILGGGAYYLLQQQTPPGPPPTPTAPERPVQPPTPSNPPPRVEQAPKEQEPVRVAANTTRETANADAAQGIKGRVLRPDGAPAAGVQLWLMESASNPVQMFLKSQSGQAPPPVGSAVSADDGTFAIGLRDPGKPVDMRLTSDEFPDFNRSGLRVREGDWFDTGDLRLEVGSVVLGRVLDATTKTPVPGAVVYLLNNNHNNLMHTTPGRERGIVAQVDANGLFQYRNAPRMAHVTLTAEAPGYASTQLANRPLKADSANEFTLEIEQGEPIRGIVVDVQGKPVAGAQIRAIGLSSKTPQQERVTSLDDGSFEFPTLRRGPYDLTTTSPYHCDLKTGNVMTGESDVKLVLRARGAIKLQVLAAGTKAPVKAYTLSLKRFFPNAPNSFANVPDFPDRRITPADYAAEYGGDWALVRGVPAGNYRFQISDERHAKSMSPDFLVKEDGEPLEIVAQMTLGGTITGSVIDDRGAPVAGATVVTDLNGGLAADSPLREVFVSMMPERHTNQSTRTDSQGRFVLTKLAFADYMVRVAHPRFCEGKAVNLKLTDEGQSVDAGVIQLLLGTTVSGTTMVGGQPMGQIKVQLTTPMTPEIIKAAQDPNATPAQQQEAARQMFSVSVLSDGDGRFKLPKRVPPGTYRVTASRQGSQDMFRVLMDVKESERQVTLVAGQEDLTLDFNLPAN